MKAFEKASLAREYYDSFDVNSKNFMQKSEGTTSWIADCLRLLERCRSGAGKGEPAEVRAAFDVLFGLLERLDHNPDQILFFADEAGAWQVGVDWKKVFPTYFEVLSKTSGSDEYAPRVIHLIDTHYAYGRAKMVTAARKAATAVQRAGFPRSPATRTARHRK